MLVRSYRSAFILLFTALLVLTTAAVAFNAYRRAAEVSLGLSEDIIDQMSEKVMERTLAIFEAAYADLEINALALAGRGLTAERDAVFRLFWKQLELKPQLLSLFAANPAGDFLLVRDRPQLVTRWIDRSGERPREQVIYRDRDYAPIAHIEGGGLFDPRDQGWYQGALAARGTVTWSPVYRIAAVERPGITAAKTVAGADGKPALVVGVDIALDGLSEFLSDHPVAKGAAAMIVDERGRLVAYPYQLRLKERAPEAPEEICPRSRTWPIRPWSMPTRYWPGQRRPAMARRGPPRAASRSCTPAGYATWPGCTPSRPNGPTAGGSSWWSRRRLC